MKLGKAVLAALVGCALALGACGRNDDKTSPAAEEQSTAAEAVREIAAVRTGLGRAVAQLRAGDRKAAEDTVAESYLQHFEKVEGPLDKVDHELNEELEETLKGELRAKISGGAPVGEVEKLVDEVNGDLDTAEAKLK
ncbi:MAG: high-affinity iron transporter [Thermoleophilaceae bacterium]|jgi:SMC interacting uncharacterized protein involved in chromosome segregation|nr:high-affinity iron transporter [Thermoleophilaceae bacterium]